MAADSFASKKFEGGWINLTTQRVLPMSITSSSFYHTAIMHQSIESPGGGGRDGAGIVDRPSALFCIVPAPRGTFFCH